MAARGNEQLLKLIHASPSRAISFERFMQEALYNEEYGYYRRTLRNIGRQGDFSTSATLSPLFGKALATWAVARAHPANSLAVWHVIEVGGGNGDLAKSFLDSLAWYRRPLVHYHIIEISEPLLELQREKLESYRVTWHQHIQSALAAADGRALIFHNELVDAFPVVKLYRHAGEWKEVHVTTDPDSGQIAEEFMPEHIARLRDVRCSVLTEWEDPSDGQICEAHVSYYEWLVAWRPFWKQGSMLTIDYGDRLPDLYYRRPDGTMRAFFEHLHLQGAEIYARFGRQDLTADVNFTDLENWGTELGIGNVGFQSQREFIMKWLPEIAQKEYRDGRLAFVLHPDGAGSAFKVLEQIAMPDGGCDPGAGI